MREHLADNQHDAHERTPDEHHLPPADMVAEIDRDRSRALDWRCSRTVPAREQRRLVAGEPGQREHVRRVDADEVDPRALLHDLDPRAQHHPPPRVQLVLPEEHAVETGRRGRLLGADGEEDLVHLALDGLGARIDAASLQHRAGSGKIPRLGQIPRRFWVEGRSGEDDDEEDDLEAEREAPGESLAAGFDADELHPVDAIIHMSVCTRLVTVCVHSHRTPRHRERKLNRHKRPPKMRIRELRRPDWNSRVQISTSNSTYDTRNRQPGDILGRSEECSPQYPPDTVDLDGLEPANCIGGVADQKGAYEQISVTDKAKKRERGGERDR